MKKNNKDNCLKLLFLLKITILKKSEFITGLIEIKGILYILFDLQLNGKGEYNHFDFSKEVIK